MPRYTKETFFDEVNSILYKPHKITPIPSRNFIKVLNRRIVQGWKKANNAGYYNDSEDYHSWGYALFDDVHKNAEREFRKINIEPWEKYYDNFERDPKIGSIIKVWYYMDNKFHDCKVLGIPIFNDDIDCDNVLIPILNPHDKDSKVYIFYNSEEKRWEFLDGFASYSK